MRFKSALFASALVGAAALTVLPAAGASADTTASIPQLTGFHQILVDDAAGYVFLSEGTTSAAWADGYGSATAGIVVTDLSGKYVTTIDAGDGVEGMTLSSDGTTLYASLAADDAVAVISAATLEQAGQYSLGSDAAPYSLALQSGKLWVSYDVPATALQPASGAIGDFDLSTASPVLEAQPVMDGAQAGLFAWYSAPDIAADPSDTGVLVAAVPVGPSLVATYNVATGPATLLSESSGIDGCAERSLAVFPGGAQFAICGTLLNTAGLPPLLPGDAGANLAATADGSLLAIAAGTSASVYRQSGGSLSAANIFDLATPDILAPAGVAFGSSNSTLYTVLENKSGTAYSLQVFADSGVTRSSLIVSGTSSVRLGGSINVTGRLTLGTGALAAAMPIKIVRSELNSTTRATFAVTSGADGSFSLSDTPTAPGTYTYTASYPGSATVGTASAAVTATVTALPTAPLSLTASASVVGYGGAAKITAHLGAAGENRAVSVYAQTAGSSARKLLVNRAVNAAGNLTVNYPVTRSTVFTAAFAGDAQYAAKTVARTVGVGVKISMADSGYFATAKVNGVSYRVFHHTANLHAAVTVAPDNSGQCVKLELQRYNAAKKAWLTSETTRCLTLGKSSTAAASLALRTMPDALYRLQADYAPSAADHANIATDGAWFYFEVVK